MRLVSIRYIYFHW